LADLALFAEVEVVARILAGLHGGPGAVADGEIGQAGRDHDGFLRAADEDVDAPASTSKWVVPRPVMASTTSRA
jgi:hypothetical protein